MFEPATEIPDDRTDIITGALLYMMTAYSRTQCPGLAAAIARHLECLASDPGTEPIVRATCEKLQVEWQATARTVFASSPTVARH
jgi:hypothetical protein